MSNRLLDEPCDLHAEIGSKPWARAVAREIRYSAKKLDSDVNHIQEFIFIAAKHEAWKVLGYVSLDAFLIKEANFTQSIIDAIRNAKGGTVGDAIAKVDSMPELPDVGPLTEKEKANGYIITNSSQRGTATEYTLRRLKRDAPELYLEVKSGELSVNAAAIQAGIRKKPTPEQICVKAFLKCDSRLVPLKVIVESLEPHERAVVMDWLKELLT